MSEDFEILHNGVRMPVRIKRNSRAQRLILRVDHISEGGVLTLPLAATIDEAILLVKNSATWLYEKIQNQPARQTFCDGYVLTLLDAAVTVRHAPEERLGVRLDGNNLLVSGRIEHLERRVFDWLKGHTKEVITPRAKFMAGQLGREVKKVSVRNTRSRWGSCSHNGNLSFCWRLIMTPNWVLNYVIAHEVSHLAHMNHSPTFWRTVGTFDVQTDQARIWLNDNNARLQRIGPQSISPHCKDPIIRER